MNDEHRDGIKKSAGGWVDLEGLSATAAGGKVREEGTHVLVNLNGHTRGEA